MNKESKPDLRGQGSSGENGEEGANATEGDCLDYAFIWRKLVYELFISKILHHILFPLLNLCFTMPVKLYSLKDCNNILQKKNIRWWGYVLWRKDIWKKIIIFFSFEV